LRRREFSRAIKNFLIDHWPNVLGAIFLVLFFSLAIYYLDKIVLAWAVVVGVIVVFFVGFYLIAIILSFPFVLYLILLGVFKHPKELITIRTGRSLVTASLIIVFFDVFGQANSLGSFFGFEVLSPSEARGFAWVSILLLLIAYSRTLYVEGYAAFRAEAAKMSSGATAAILLPARFFISLLTDFVTPFAIAFAIVIAFSCDGSVALSEIARWIAEQFSFITRGLNETFRILAQRILSEGVINEVGAVYQELVQRLSEGLAWTKRGLANLESFFEFDFALLNPFRFAGGCKV